MIYIVSGICIVFIILFTLAAIQWMVWALRLVEHYQKRCSHPNLKEERWVEKDGTCMIRAWCPDCTFYDYGHVYADPTTWINPDSVKHGTTD